MWWCRVRGGEYSPIHDANFVDMCTAHAEARGSAKRRSVNTVHSHGRMVSHFNAEGVDMTCALWQGTVYEVAHSAEGPPPPAESLIDFKCDGEYNLGAGGTCAMARYTCPCDHGASFSCAECMCLCRHEV